MAIAPYTTSSSSHCKFLIGRESDPFLGLSPSHPPLTSCQVHCECVCVFPSITVPGARIGIEPLPPNPPLICYQPHCTVRVCVFVLCVCKSFVCVCPLAQQCQKSELGSPHGYFTSTLGSSDICFSSPHPHPVFCP